MTAFPGLAARAGHTARADGTVARPGSRVSGPTATSRPPPHADFPTAARDVAAWLDAGPDARPGAWAGGDFTRIPTHSAHSAGGDVRTLSGRGRPLPDSVRTQHEARFGVPLTHVRVHDHPVAHALARRHLARAFTVGPDIVFGEGRYQPASPAGRGLLGHELTHVVQQTGRPGASPADAGHEAAAEAAARTAEAGAPVRGRQVPGVLPAAVGIQAAALSQAEIQQLLLPQLIERIAENERETRVVALSEEYRAELTREHTWLVQRHTELTRGQSLAPPPVKPEVLAEIDTELAELEPLAARLVAAVPAHPRDHALNTVRGVARRAATDRDFLRQTVQQGGPAEVPAKAALARVERVIAQLTPVVAQAEAWHAAHPAGKSLGMRNEALGTSLAGTALSDWSRGGWYYVRGVAAFIGAGGIAVIDAGEQLLSFGFHDAATAVSEAYTRGDLSWNEGEEILWSATWRALLIAAVTRGAGAATSRLGSTAARAVGLAPRSLGAGLVSGGVAGGASGAASLGTQALLTTVLESHFSSLAGREIWQKAMPSGGEWALAIPLGLLLGAVGGARAVKLGNEKLIGSTFTTSYGEELRIVAITPEGQVVVKPAAGLSSPPGPPPATTVEMVYDPAQKTWRAHRPTTSMTKAPAAPAAQAPTAPAPQAAPTAPAPAPKAAPTVASPRTQVPALPAAPVPTPATPRTAAADLRVAETRAALSAAARETALARAEVAAATGEVQTAQAGRRPGGPTVKQAETALRQAENRLNRLSASEGAAQGEAAAAARAQAEIARLEKEIVRLEGEITAELNPPGEGARAKLNRESRIPGVTPPSGQPSGAKYTSLEAELKSAWAKLAKEVSGLDRTLRAQVEAGTPGRAGRAPALGNANRLDPALRPANGTPIDVTTGAPMTTAAWETDHLMSRSEIAADPRFPRLTPLQRNAMLRGVPENYLPMTEQANLDKSNWTVAEWITRRQATKRPLPKNVAEALLKADRLARDAVEAKFREFLPD
ncbi:DUF4157 domain-containing protein [Streptomyces sp. NPDC017964]|uniref:DUF4157 domain-containing protein n=1 Tax=Streptomyces sp. NPDC017964 TaxID=3365022 RepID=UPI003788CC38